MSSEVRWEEVQINQIRSDSLDFQWVSCLYISLFLLYTNRYYEVLSINQIENLLFRTALFSWMFINLCIYHWNDIYLFSWCSCYCKPCWSQQICFYQMGSSQPPYYDTFIDSFWERLMFGYSNLDYDKLFYPVFHPCTNNHFLFDNYNFPLHPNSRTFDSLYYRYWNILDSSYCIYYPYYWISPCLDDYFSNKFYLCLARLILFHLMSSSLSFLPFEFPSSKVCRIQTCLYSAMKLFYLFIFLHHLF